MQDSTEPEWLEAKRRNSGIALTRDGDWRFGTRSVENPRVQAMFHRGVAVRPDGEVTLKVGHMWCYVQAAGVIHFVRAVRELDGEAPVARLLGDREVALGEDTIAGWGPDERLYLWIAGLEGPAICLREAHQALAARLVGEETPRLLLGRDRSLALVMLPAIPPPDAPRPAQEAPGSGFGGAPEPQA